jgi:hypothetical protein
MKIYSTVSAILFTAIVAVDDWGFQVERQDYRGRKSAGCRREDFRRGDRWRWLQE